MPVSPGFMRTALVICIVAMSALAEVYLYKREMSVREYILWGLLAVALPLVGPYIVIAAKPGRWRTVKEKDDVYISGLF